MEFSSTTNRLTKIGNIVIPANWYDGAGNLTQTDAGHSYQWDAEGRLKSVDNGSNGGAVLVYNALGQRVDQSGSGVHYHNLFHANGEELGDWWPAYNDWGNAYFNLNGRPIAKYVGTVDPWTIFMHTNALGSTTMVTDPTGAVSRAGAGWRRHRFLMSANNEG